MSSAESNASSGWAARIFHAALIATLLAVVGFRVYGYFVNSEPGGQNAETKLDDKSLRELQKTAYDAFREEQWTAAAEAFGELADRDPQNAQVRWRLAYALTSSGQHDEALGEFLYITQFQRIRPWALYQVGKIYAIKNRRQLALDHLSESISEGYRLRKEWGPVLDDPDFANLRDDPEFQQLAELFKRSSEREVYKRYEFLIGKWELVAEQDKRIGTLDFAKCSDKYSILGTWFDEALSTSTTIFLLYDPLEKVWEQTWSMGGVVTEVKEVSTENNSWVFAGHQASDVTQTKEARIVIRDSVSGMLRIKFSTSDDEGVSWQDALDAGMLPVLTSDEQKPGGS